MTVGALETHDLTVTEGTAYSYDDGTLVVTGDVTITGTTTTENIKVTTNNAEVTLDNVDIQLPDTGCAFAVEATGVIVNLAAGSTNTLQSGRNDSNPDAALQVETGHSVTIQGTGVLKAIGGQATAPAYNGGAGIGSGYDRNAGTITIDGGIIEAIPGWAAAGVGGGRAGTGGTIAINGGTVTSYGNGDLDRAIGAGYGETTGIVTIGSAMVYGWGSSFETITSYTDGTGETVTFPNRDDADYAKVTDCPFTVSAGIRGTDYTYENHTLSVSGTVTIATDAPLTSEKIVATGNNANITLNGVSIDLSTVDKADACALDVQGTTIITLADGSENTLKSGRNDESPYAGLQVNTGKILTINGGEAGTGSLTATGGLFRYESSTAYGGAGIGGENATAGGTITINGGHITAIGGYNAAGIGGGRGQGSTSITINGGDITAKGTFAGKGIGGGWDGSDGTIAINGGTILASSGESSAIGGSPTVGANMEYGTGASEDAITTFIKVEDTAVTDSTFSAKFAKLRDFTLSAETDITDFTIPNQVGASTIDADKHTVAVAMPCGTDVKKLTPTIVLSEGATIDPASSVEQDFTSAKTYTVTAEDGTTTQAWVVTVSFSGKEVTPEATFTATGAYSGTLSDVTDSMKYKIGDGAWMEIVDTSVSLAGLSACTITVVNKGNGTTTTDSDVQTITVSKATTPTLTETQPTTIDGQGSIPMDANYEYQIGDDTTWIPATGTANLDAGTYHVRVKAKDQMLASAAQTIILNAYVPTKATLPTATFVANGADTATLGNVTTNMKYQIDSGEWVDISGITVALTGLSACTINVVNKGNGTTTEDSEIQTIIVTKADQPALEATQPTTIDGQGSIPMDANYEYQIGDDTTWIAATGTTSLDAGTYHVRVKAAGTVLASDVQNITLNDYVAGAEVTPIATFVATGTDSGILGHVTAGMEYSIDNDTTWIPITSSADVTIGGVTSEYGIHVIKRGDDSTTTDSVVQTISVTKAEAPTTAGKTDCTTADNNDGTLTGVTATMEYSVDNGTTWTHGDGATITGLGNGTYLVRVKAAGTVLASDNQTVEIEAYVAPVISGGSNIPAYRPTVADSENGSVKVNPESPRKGQTVTITVIPDKGYAVDKIIVTDKDGKEVVVTANPNGTFTFTQPAGQVIIAVTYKELATDIPFTDVNKADWFYEAMKYVYENGYMYGTEDTTFSPYAGTTRGMIVTVLHRIEETPGVNYAMAFGDVANDMYYTESIRWATSEAIVKGYDNGNYGPNDYITREQLATILYRYAMYQGMDVTENTNILSYKDAFDISEYAIPAMQWACDAGILTGKGDGVLDPAGLATRAEVSMMLMRFMNLNK